jgi:hypothetical protein
MSEHDSQLPEDLRDIAERLSAARVTPSRFELDELYQRVYVRFERGGSPWRGRRFAGVLRMNLVAAVLTLGLVLTSGVGVVLASEWFGGGSNTYQDVNFKGYDDADCKVENSGSWSSSYSWKTHDSTLYVNVVWNCKYLTIHVTCGDPISYEWGGGSWTDTKSESYTTIGSSGIPDFSVTAGGTTHTLPFTW